MWLEPGGWGIGRVLLDQAGEQIPTRARQVPQLSQTNPLSLLGKVFLQPDI